MCKIFAMTNMEKVNVNQKFLEVVKKHVCKHSDKDGFGYAVLGKTGELGGERTMRPHNFKPLKGDPKDRIVNKLPIVMTASDIFGKIDLPNPKAFIAHGRFSTNIISLENTHPFTNGEVAMIHNGVVADDSGDVKDSLVTSCDSEIILRYWEKGGMGAVEENVSGYYALAILDKKGKLHVARDDTAMLYITYVRKVHSYMIATTREIIEGVCKSMRWDFEMAEEVTPNTYAIFDGNEILAHRTIKPIGRSYAVNSLKANAALGHYDEYDSDKEPAPRYRELVENDNYYKNLRNKYINETSEYPEPFVDESEEANPGFQETGLLQHETVSDDAPIEETYAEDQERVVDCVDDFIQKMNRNRYSA